MPTEFDRPGSTPTSDAGLGQQAGIVTAASAVVSGSSGPAGGGSSLPAVLADVPVAVLVIDRLSSSVVYANTAAVELAGTVHLPVDVEIGRAHV